MMTAPSSSPALSIVIPVYNESGRLGPTLARVGEYAERSREPVEIIVVDDGSTDDTVQLAARFARGRADTHVIQLGENRGKGAAVRAGMLASRGDHVLFSDADLATPIEELDKLRRALAADCDVAVGSRVAPGEVERVQPLGRKLVSVSFRVLARLLGFRVFRAVRDTQCGFKMFSRRAAHDLFSRVETDGFAFDVELLELAVRDGRVAEVPVVWNHQPGSKVRPVRDGMRMLRDMIKIQLGFARRALGRRQLGAARPALPAGR